MFFLTNRKLRSIAKTLKEISSAGEFKKVQTTDAGPIKELVDAINETMGTLRAQTETLRVENRQREAIIASMTEGVIALDNERRIILVNPASERIFGISQSNTLGKFFLEAIRNNEIFELVSLVFEKHASASREITLSSSIRTIYKVSAAPLASETNAHGCVLLFYDMTEIRKLESTRAEFVANISHELKTPLTSIKGFVETLLEGAIDDTENRENFLRIIQEHTGRLEHLISELLDLARIESRSLVLKRESIMLKDFFDIIGRDQGAALRNRHITFTNSIPQSIRIEADKEQFLRAVSNIIDNAIKFNRESGSITIDASQEPGRVRVTVQDSGIGISGADKERVFERFYQTDKARSRSKSGAGLGLAIVKHIIELHGGAIGVESAEGQGSTFWFTIPIQ